MRTTQDRLVSHLAFAIALKPKLLIDLSRLQAAATAMHHVLLVPLTPGMVWLLDVMESVGARRGKVAPAHLCASEHAAC